MKLENQVAIVTGGSRGIGRAVCLELARRGAHVVLCYAGNTEAAQSTVAACEALGVRALAIQASVADEAAIQTLVAQTLETFGRVDILVNSAGITRDGLTMRMSQADFDAVVDTNLKGTFLCMKAVTRPMMKQRYGRIVNLSSVVGLRGNAGQVNYAASKAGVIGMTKSLAQEWAKYNITVNGIAPGYFPSELTGAYIDAPAFKKVCEDYSPMGRPGITGEMDGLCIYLASDASSFTTGQMIAVDGGWLTI